jgi:anaerobic magnesium-protoporphyrin IX monomethyl ester cyclase
MAYDKKKKLLLITLVDVSAYGARCLSAYIRSRGRVADILLLRLSDTRRSFLSLSPGGKVSSTISDALLQFIREYDYVGISLFSDGYNESVQLTMRIKQVYPDKKVIWGGIHPTLSPEDSLLSADYVCVGEGYYSLSSLLDQLDNSSCVPETLPIGIWGKTDDGIIRNGASQLCLDFDSLPFPNYDEGTVFVRNNDNTFSHLTKSKYREYMDYAYYTMMSQGCPNNCAYCCNNALKNLSKQYATIRKKSVDYMIREIKEAQKNYTFYNVFFMDDSFIMMDDVSFDEFVDRYPKEIGLPMIIIGFIPRLTKAKHVNRLVEAGMIRGRIGVQSGSKKMLDVYHRKQTNEEIVRTSELFAAQKGKIVPVGCDIILDGYNETTEDTIETARLISKLKHPYLLNLCSLRSYPGTEIRQYMDNYKPGVSYKNVENKLINCIVGFMSIVNLSEGVINFLIDKKRLMAMRVPNGLVKIIYYSILIKKTIYHLYYGDYSSKPYWLVDVARRFKKITQAKQH